MTNPQTTTYGPKLVIQGYNPVPEFAHVNQDGDNTTVHLEDRRLTIERRGLDAVISIGDKSLLFPRFDNVCSQIATWLRENHHG